MEAGLQRVSDSVPHRVKGGAPARKIESQITLLRREIRGLMLLASLWTTGPPGSGGSPALGAM